jgi:hypothetical protein
MDKLKAKNKMQAQQILNIANLKITLQEWEGNTI